VIKLLHPLLQLVGIVFNYLVEIADAQHGAILRNYYFYASLNKLYWQLFHGVIIRFLHRGARL
jgi:hypothetical protein